MQVRKSAEVEIWEDRGAASRTFNIQTKPLVDTFDVEIMSTWHTTDLHKVKMNKNCTKRVFSFTYIREYPDQLEHILTIS